MKEQGEKCEEGRGGKIVFHTLTDVAFMQLTDCFICSPMKDEKKNPYSTHVHPKGNFRHTHKYSGVSKQSGEKWVASGSA